LDRDSLGIRTLDLNCFAALGSTSASAFAALSAASAVRVLLLRLSATAARLESKEKQNQCNYKKNRTFQFHIR
jgi:hypothetical protein